MRKPEIISYKLKDGRVNHCDIKFDLVDEMVIDKINRIEKISMFEEWQPASIGYVNYIKGKLKKV